MYKSSKGGDEIKKTSEPKEYKTGNDRVDTGKIIKSTDKVIKVKTRTGAVITRKK